MTRNLATLTDDEIVLPGQLRREEGFGALETGRGRLPLRALSAHARVEGLLSQVTLTQTYVNSFPEPIEATYIFPLPERAGVTHFRMEVAGRVVEGQLKERGQARRDYDQAIQQGNRAAITEEERSGVFTLRVGNLLPGEEATITLTFSGPLSYSNGEATFRFPLVVAPRYIPGNPLPGPSVGAGTATDTDAVPDASRISPPVLLPGFPNPVRLGLTVEVLPSPLVLGEARSSLHAVEEERAGRVRWISVRPGERLDRDFILRFRVDPSALHTGLLLQPDSPTAREGTFLLSLVPPLAQAAPRPRDVVFVIDRSGSMSGWKMVVARRAVGRMVDTLLDHDRFTVLAFDDAIETPLQGGDELLAASDRQRFQVIEWLARVDARGGTELAEPLKRAVDRLRGSAPGRERVLVLITDGQVGNEDQIVRSLGKRLKELRVFTLGIDQAVNAAFLRRLAELGGGDCELVESEDRLDEVMEHVHRRIGQPVMSHLQLEPAGLTLEADSVVPERAPDLFPGTPVLLSGRYQGLPEGAIVVHAVDHAGRPWSTRVNAVLSGQGVLGTVWARGQVRKLEDRYLLRPQDHAELERRILDTSLKFGVLCKFTAYVAVDRTEVANPDGSPREVVQPVELPAGWEQHQARLQAMPLSAGNNPLNTLLSRVRAPACRTSYSAPPSPAPAAQPPSDSDECEDVDFDEDSGVTATDFDPLEATAKREQPPPRPASRGPAKRKSRSAPPPARSRGLLGHLFGSVFGGGGPEEESEQALPARRDSQPDLSPIRAEAKGLLDGLTAQQGEAGPVRLARLRQLTRTLDELRTKLQGASPPEATALEAWLRQFRAFQSQPVLDTAELERLWAALEAILQALASGSPLPPPPAREGFWK